MPIDVNRLSVKELDALINQAKKRKTTLSRRKPLAVVRAKLTQLAKAEGYSLAELFGGKTPGPGATGVASKPRKAKSAKGAKVPPKYRNPDNAAQTWSGRGMQPRWMASEVAKGRKPEDFLIR
jgi:DNA-binding protein H-NS